MSIHNRQDLYRTWQLTRYKWPRKWRYRELSIHTRQDLYRTWQEINGLVFVKDKKKNSCFHFFSASVNLCFSIRALALLALGNKMSNLRVIWNFMPQNYLYRRMLNSIVYTITSIIKK